MNHWSRSLLIALGVVLVPCAARAAEPTKLECIAANDAAQDLRRAGKLREAREKLLLCGSTSCPGPVREDCTQRLTEVDGVMPSLVFEAKDGAGNDVAGVTVTMDGQRVDKPGMPVQADPGEHRFVFEAEGLPKTEKTIVVREGERDRHERVVLGLAGAPGPMTPAPPSSESGSQKTIAYAVGGAGVVGLVIGSVLGLVSKSSYDHALQTECGNSANGCSPQGIQDGQSAHGQATASTVAFVAGGLLLAGGAVLYFTAPKTSGVVVGAGSFGTSGTGMIVGGSW
jgi:serine/threonine-protein kinase